MDSIQGLKLSLLFFIGGGRGQDLGNLLGPNGLHGGGHLLSLNIGLELLHGLHLAING